MKNIGIQNIEYYQYAKEGQYLDRKSAKKSPKDILRHIVAFANAEGGQLAIGIEDDGSISGFERSNTYKVDDYINVSLTELRNTPLRVNHTTIDVKNMENEPDQILILDIPVSPNRVIKSFDEKTYLRQSDQSISLNADQVIQLEYDRGQRFFEDELLYSSSIKDIDLDLLQNYREKMDAPELSDSDILEARNLMIDDKITNAGILLFGKNPTKFLPQARIKVVKYEGNSAEVGSNINIVKEQTFDASIPILITGVSDFIRIQLREFQYLDKDNGQFKKMSEYPEFAWFEGIVNALTHRDYSIRGDYIKILLFDNRMEINSPGLLPNIVTVENIKYTRYSRNPRIARVLSEFGWVKEMNEGVKRIYTEMENLFLNEPVYSEPNNNVLLILKNNIISRHIRVSDKLTEMFETGVFESLTEDEKLLIMVTYNTGEPLNTTKAAKIIDRSKSHSRRLLQQLHENKILVWHGTSTTDSRQYYTLNI